MSKVIITQYVQEKILKWEASLLHYTMWLQKVKVVSLLMKEMHVKQVIIKNITHSTLHLAYFWLPCNFTASDASGKDY